MATKKEPIEIIESKNIFVGNAKAPVTLTEFGEYENEDCAKANEIVKKLLEEYDEELRFNFRHFPLTQIHQRSMKASEAAMAAAQEGKFWEMHNVLFDNRRNLGITSLKMLSKEAGVTNKHFLSELVDSKYSGNVRADLLEGLDKGVREIPAFFINGEPFIGKPSFENLGKAIDAALKKSKSKTLAKQRA